MDPLLWGGVESLVLAAREGAKIPPEDEWRLRWTAGLVMEAHKGQLRRDGYTPYFIHPLQVTMKAIELGVRDPVALQISLAHEGREDSEEYYTNVMKALFQQIVDFMGSGSEKDKEYLRFNHFRLGVRMLTKMTGEEYEAPYEGLPRAEAEKRMELDYYRTLLDPRSHFRTDPDNPKRSTDYDDAFIRDIHRIKLADRLVNIADLMSLFIGDQEPNVKTMGLPMRTFNKTAEVFIPRFVEASAYLTNGDRRIFYDQLVKMLEEYAALDLEKNPQAGLLRDAAEQALQNPIFRAMREGYSAYTEKAAKHEDGAKPDAPVRSGGPGRAAAKPKGSLEAGPDDGGFGLDGGATYLILGQDPGGSVRLFSREIVGGAKGLYITRSNPDQVRRKHTLPETKIVWLTNVQTGDEAESVNGIQELSLLVSNFIDGNSKGAILFEGLEYLISNHGFPPALKLIQQLRDRVSTSQAKMLVPVNPDALEERQLSLLKNECQTIKQP
jgi:hypothetical protein